METNQITATAHLDGPNDISAFASTDETRYVLNGIRLGKDYTEATDGRMLVRVPYRDGSEKPAEAFILPAGDVKAAVAGLKKCKVVSAVTVSKNCTRATLADENVSRTVELIDGQWPNTDQVWPGGEPVLSITLDGRLLAVIAKYASTLQDRDERAPVRFDFTSGTEAVVWSTRTKDGWKVKGLLMPMRTE